MKAGRSIVLLLALFAAPAEASTSTDRMRSCAATWHALSDAAKAATTYAAFSAHCLKAAVESGPPSGATGVCEDGSYTTATHRGNVCYRHGGLARWLPRQ
jgi:hypothetical protein